MTPAEMIKKLYDLSESIMSREDRSEALDMLNHLKAADAPLQATGDSTADPWVRCTELEQERDELREKTDAVFALVHQLNNEKNALRRRLREMTDALDRLVEEFLGKLMSHSEVVRKIESIKTIAEVNDGREGVVRNDRQNENDSVDNDPELGAAGGAGDEVADDAPEWTGDYSLLSIAKPWRCRRFIDGEGGTSIQIYTATHREIICQKASRLIEEDAEFICAAVNAYTPTRPMSESPSDASLADTDIVEELQNWTPGGKRIELDDPSDADAVNEANTRMYQDGAPSDAPYGYCPLCGEKGRMRERGLNGDDICINRHKYPSRDALPTRPTSGSPIKLPAVCAALSDALTVGDNKVGNEWNVGVGDGSGKIVSDAPMRVDPLDSAKFNEDGFVAVLMSCGRNSDAVNDHADAIERLQQQKADVGSLNMEAKERVLERDRMQQQIEEERNIRANEDVEVMRRLQQQIDTNKSDIANLCESDKENTAMLEHNAEQIGKLFQQIDTVRQSIIDSHTTAEKERIVLREAVAAIESRLDATPDESE